MRELFCLQTDHTTYLVGVSDAGFVEQLYYGAKIETPLDPGTLREKHAAPYPMMVYDREAPLLGQDDLCLEYSASGRGDFRECALELETQWGSRTADLRYRSHFWLPEKPALPGLPSSYGSEQNLVITLADEALDVTVELHYSVFPSCDVITRHALLKNGQKTSLKLHRMYSAQLDLAETGDTFVTFDGGWAVERTKHEKPLSPGIYVNDSKTGTSSARHNPFVILARPHCTEDQGDCFGLNLVYSGSHAEAAEETTLGKTRLLTGLNPAGFCWNLAKGASFCTPEAVLCFSDGGFNGLSARLHPFVRSHIVRGHWRDRERPMLVNNWEGTFFDFDEEKLLNIAREGADLGLELFVLDDGWFGRRDDDRTSLGDWTVDRRKLPHGLKYLAEQVNALGLLFGLWFEPEMVSEESELYRAHPDWALKCPERLPAQGRTQLVLDLTRAEVRDYIVKSVSQVLESANIQYVKWDMNRHLSDVSSAALPPEQQGEVLHRYVLGLYEIYERLTDRFPQVLFEGCSSGGNRFDLGILCYMPQIWASDNTDALCRMEIQEGTSYAYPQSTMGAHVSATAFHTAGRFTLWETRFNVAAFGCLGYELDLTKLTPEEKACLKRQVDWYRAHRKTLQFGQLYRLPAPKNQMAWCSVAQDKKAAVAGFFQKSMRPTLTHDTLTLRGLDGETAYVLRSRPQLQEAPEREEASQALEEYYRARGDQLNLAGIRLAQQSSATGWNENMRAMGDLSSRLYTLEAE